MKDIAVEAEADPVRSMFSISAEDSLIFPVNRESMSLAKEDTDTHVGPIR